METNTQGKNQPSDEVNFEPIIVWFSTLLNGISTFFKKLAYSVIVDKKRVITLVILGTALGGLFFGVVKRHYQVGMTLNSNQIDNQTCYTLIWNLGKLAGDESYERLAEELNISEDLATEIRSMFYMNITGTLPIHEDTVVLDRNFRVTMEVYNQDSIETLQNAIVDYLGSNPYGLLLQNRKKLNLEQRATGLEIEIEKLDSILQKVNASIIPRSGGQGIILGEPIDPVKIVEQSKALRTELIYVNSELDLLTNIDVISEFVPSDKPFFPKLNVVVIGSFLGFILGLILASFRNFSKYEE